MKVPDAVKREAVAELEATALLVRGKAYDRIRGVVPHRFRVELIEAPDGARRLFWPTEVAEPVESALPLRPRDR